MGIGERDPDYYIKIEEATYIFDTKKEYDKFIRIEKLKHIKKE